MLLTLLYLFHIQVEISRAGCSKFLQFCIFNLTGYNLEGKGNICLV